MSTHSPRAPRAPEHTWATVHEAARSLSVDAKTIRRWVADDLLPSRRIGGTIRIPVAALRYEPEESSE